MCSVCLRRRSTGRWARRPESGWSIVNVAKKLGINYSTAKSITQSYRRNGKPELIETQEGSLE